ncbi:MAG: hypothetical protein JXB29_07410 [Sedimentisphaerales bacterium]|nr:hypothetical protein [Sedimentisphaerales bacterium]
MQLIGLVKLNRGTYGSSRGGSQGTGKLVYRDCCGDWLFRRRAGRDCHIYDGSRQEAESFMSGTQQRFYMFNLP